MLKDTGLEGKVEKVLAGLNANGLEVLRNVGLEANVEKVLAGLNANGLELLFSDTGLEGKTENVLAGLNANGLEFRNVELGRTVGVVTTMVVDVASRCSRRRRAAFRA